MRSAAYFGTISYAERDRGRTGRKDPEHGVWSGIWRPTTHTDSSWVLRFRAQDPES